MQQLTMDFSRGRQNELSKEAFEKVKKSTPKSYDDILNLTDGYRCTFETCAILGKELHKLSGRFSELRAKGLIEFSHKKEINGAKYSVYKKTNLHL